MLDPRREPAHVTRPLFGTQVLRDPTGDLSLPTADKRDLPPPWIEQSYFVRGRLFRRFRDLDAIGFRASQECPP